MTPEQREKAGAAFEKWWSGLTTDHGYKMRYQIRDSYLAGAEWAWGELCVCTCGEFDVEFGIHCNSCTRDKIDKLELELSRLQDKLDLCQNKDK